MVVPTGPQLPTESRPSRMPGTAPLEDPSGWWQGWQVAGWGMAGAPCAAVSCTSHLTQASRPLSPLTTSHAPRFPLSTARVSPRLVGNTRSAAPRPSLLASASV